MARTKQNFHAPDNTTPVGAIVVNGLKSSTDILAQERLRPYTGSLGEMVKTLERHGVTTWSMDVGDAKVLVLRGAKAAADFAKAWAAITK